MEQFENWIHNSEKYLSPTSFALFFDSIRCYKAEVYRAAYLLAYQGMLWQIKENFKQGKCPTGITAGEWNQHLSKLQEDKQWDFEIYDLIMKKPVITKGILKKPPFLTIADDIRSQFEYWRTLRNVCAHQKEVEFFNAYVLVLYCFIRENLLSITVEGSAASLLSEFERFFDPCYTSPKEKIIS